MRKLLVLMLVLIVTLSGCASIITDIPNFDNNTEPNTPAIEEPQNESENEFDKDDEVSGIKNLELIEANKQFSWEILKKINEDDSGQEVFISPLSISSMLMMAYNGAEGNTKSQMAEAMHYEGISVEDLNAGYKYLLDKLNNIDKKVSIEIANSMWLRQGFNIEPSFIDINGKFLFADAKSLDFSDPNSATEINNWIARKTNNLIKSVINPPIADDVVMYLINAIYFNGEWTNEFKEKNTIEANFNAYDGVADTVQMMQRSGGIYLAETDEFKAVSLPYGDEKVSMVVILPEGDINQFISSFDNEKWYTLINNLRPSKVDLQLPKFKMEYGLKELNKALVSLGMEEMFSHKANFSGISRDVFINRVLHKAVVDVNEKGTEAAAVTVGEVAAVSYVEPVNFIADRPFMFVICDTEDWNILFAGKKLFGDR
ncbi:MAG: serpin family protein [Clostridiaceae bacterium]|jgi:serine protease inhibitor|nr:serpin family protein [Clostridiaceae bacterium]